MYYISLQSIQCLMRETIRLMIPDDQRLESTAANNSKHLTLLEKMLSSHSPL